ncbi:MAG: 30S ribosomal protein THX [Chitinophagales bacterium]|jgi:ribosomal small subunit protein bTHX|nr:30S ribosomal protein THX [Chitinophagales bacterium]
MGRGDKRTKRGKITKGSFGNSRPRVVHKIVQPEPAVTEAAVVPKEEAKKRPAKKKEK